MDRGWIGVDLDGTLAEYDVWRGAGHVGEPIQLMVDRVKRWIDDGVDVRIMTARVHPSAGADAEVSRDAIQAWCAEQFGKTLPVTCEKDFSMLELWDDRAVRLLWNTGLVSDGSDVNDPLAVSDSDGIGEFITG